jgi:hypothetical protein
MAKGAGKVMGFMLHGERPQSHAGFLQRVKLELQGQAFLNHKPDLKVVDREVMFPDIAPDSRDFAIEELLRLLCDQLELNPDEKAPLLEQRFGKLLRESKLTHSLRDKDVVLLHLRINFDQWESPLCIPIMDWLTHAFFDESVMEAGSPKVLLFWGLLYNSRPVVKKLTQDALSTQVKALKSAPIVLRELQAVANADINAWLERHAPSLSDEAVERIWADWFQNPKDFDMRKVEDHLGEIIELINQQELE